VFTEGEDYFAGMAREEAGMGREEAFKSDSTALHNPPQRNYISSQFSMNIANYCEEGSPKGKVRFRKIAKKVHYAHEPQLKRHNTTN
jgi:hypothetical protein